MSFAKEILKIKVPENERLQIMRDISNWQKVQLLFDKKNDEELIDFLRKALSIELKTKKRVAIVKRLHQGLHNLVRQKDFSSLMAVLDD